MKAFIVSIPVFLLLISISYSCQKDKPEKRDYPQIRTVAVDHITGDGARFNALIISGSAESIIEYGFVWGASDQLSVAGSEKVVIEESPALDQFYSDVTFALESMKDYFVRAYVKCGELTIYGDPVKFKSLGSQAPVITGFEPKSATWGDTVTIYGRNFSYQGLKNTVFFGEKVTPSLISTNEFIKVRVPEVTSVYSAIAVEILGNRVIADGMFELLSPGKITSFKKADITWGDTLEITGIFPFSTHTIKVLISNTVATISENSDDKLKVIVPLTIAYEDSVKVALSVDSHIIEAPRQNHMITPFITSVGLGEFGWGDTIEIRGLFNPVKNSNAVTFTTTSCTILEATRQKIRCIVPDIGINHTSTLKIVTGGYELQYAEQLSLAGPVIENILPDKALSGTYLSIKGKYFREGETLMTISGKYAGVYYISSRSIGVNVPDLSVSGFVPVTIQVFDKIKTYTNLLSIIYPVITDFSPGEGTFGDVVTVTGNDFDINDIQYGFDEYNLSSDFLEKAPGSVKFRIPNTGVWEYSPIFIRTNGITIHSSQNFHVFAPVINSVNPIEGLAGDIVVIDGEYFNPDQAYNQVYFAGILANITNSTRNRIECVVPQISRGNYSFWVGNGSTLTAYNQNFTCTDTWRLANVHGYQTLTYGSSFLYNDRIYIVGGIDQNNQLSTIITTYSIIDNSFDYVFDELDRMIGNFAFQVNGIGYFGLGVSYDNFAQKTGEKYYRNIRQVNPLNYTIDTLNQFPGAGRKHPFAFSVGSHGYVGSGENDTGMLKDFWEYDPSVDHWTQLPDIPGGAMSGATAIVLDSRVIIVNGTDVWMFDSGTKSWSAKADFPGLPRKAATGFSLQGNVYYGTGSDKLTYGTQNQNYMKDFWQYNPVSDSWKRMRDLPGAVRAGAFGVGYLGKGYLGFGSNIIIDYEWQLRDVYEYDPAYE